MTNKIQSNLLNLKNKNCQNIKRLPHSFYILKVKCTSILVFVYIFMLQLWWNNIKYHFMHTCYRIYGYFQFQLFTYNLSSDVHSATLSKKKNIQILTSLVTSLKLKSWIIDNFCKRKSWNDEKKQADYLHHHIHHIVMLYNLSVKDILNIIDNSKTLC